MNRFENELMYITEQYRQYQKLLKSSSDPKKYGQYLQSKRRRGKKK